MFPGTLMFAAMMVGAAFGWIARSVAEYYDQKEKVLSAGILISPEDLAPDVVRLLHDMQDARMLACKYARELREMYGESTVENDEVSRPWLRERGGDE